jgi:hypothetical protein
MRPTDRTPFHPEKTGHPQNTGGPAISWPDRASDRKPRLPSAAAKTLASIANVCLRSAPQGRPQTRPSSLPLLASPAVPHVPKNAPPSPCATGSASASSPTFRIRSLAARLFSHTSTRLHHLHSDDRGAITLLTVIAVIGLAMTLGMVINVGRSIDSKVRRQHAADAATYSGTVVLARGMNAIAFSNHMLSEVFALTAYFREGRDRNAESLVEPILQAWERTAEIFGRASFLKFTRLGTAIPPRIQQERRLVQAFGDMTAVKSRLMLPVFEFILGVPEALNGQPVDFGGEPARTHLIPEFQRAVVRVVPQIAHLITLDVTRRHLGQGTPARPVTAALWRSRVQRVGSQSEQDPLERTLPCIDPSPEGYDAQSNNGVLSYLSTARSTRNDLAHMYLDSWNGRVNIAYDGQGDFDQRPFYRDGPGEGARVSAKLSRFHDLWRAFTCKQLNQLLHQEYPTTNMPHMLRNYADGRDPIVTDHTFVGTVFLPESRSFLPGMFGSNEPDAERPHMQTFTQSFLYLPRRRYTNGAHWLCPNVNLVGGTTGEFHCVDDWPTAWDTFSQNWGVRLTPATTPNLANILATSPGELSVRARQHGSLTTDEIRRISFH